MELKDLLLGVITSIVASYLYEVMKRNDYLDFPQK